MTSVSDLYSGVFKALLTEEALDQAGRINRSRVGLEYDEISTLTSVTSLDDSFVSDALLMSAVYVVVAAFENSVREFVEATLLEEAGATWWDDCVPSSIRKGAEKRRDEEQKVRWHTQRGESLIHFTMLPNLLAIIRNNFDKFEASVHDIDWATSIFETIDRSRNVIMHSGALERKDIARLGSCVRDWTQQVST